MADDGADTGLPSTASPSRDSRRAPAATLASRGGPRHPPARRRPACGRRTRPGPRLSRATPASRWPPRMRSWAVAEAALRAPVLRRAGASPPPPPGQGGGKRREGARRSSQPSTSGRGRTHPPLPRGCSFNKTSPVCFQCSILFSFEQPAPLPAPVSPGAYNSTARQPCRPPAPFPTAGPHPFPRAGDALLRVRPADRGTQPGRSPAKPIPDSHQPFPGTGSALSSAGNPPAQPSEQSRQQPSPGCCCAGLRRARCTPVW